MYSCDGAACDRCRDLTAWGSSSCCCSAPKARGVAQAMPRHGLSSCSASQGVWTSHGQRRLMQEHVGLGHNGPGRHPLARAQLRSPHVALHAAAALVAPFWHEEVYARKASMQGAAALRSSSAPTPQPRMPRKGRLGETENGECLNHCVWVAAYGVLVVLIAVDTSQRRPVHCMGAIVVLCCHLSRFGQVLTENVFSGIFRFLPSHVLFSY